MWKIGNVEIKNKIVMAPMAGISNSATRKIAKEMGCGLIYTEMVSNMAIVKGNLKTIEMLYMEEEERPIAQQVFGSDIDSFVIASKYIYEKMRPDIIDINMGCPVPKVALKSQAGSALLKDPQKIYEIVRAVVLSVPIPVTVKIRSGWDKDSINAVLVAQAIERAGGSAICLHGKTRSQGYSGMVDLDIIKEVKASVNIPVIGNGDIKSCYDAKRMLDYTKCDAVMIGRASLGNPWIFKECVDYLEKSLEPSFVSLTDRINMIYKHLAYLLELKTEKVVVLEMRSYIAWYLKGVPKMKEVKRKLNNIKSISDIKCLLEEIKNENNY